VAACEVKSPVNGAGIRGGRKGGSPWRKPKDLLRPDVGIVMVGWREELWRIVTL